MSTTIIQQSEGGNATRLQPSKSRSSPGLLRRLTTKLKPVLRPRTANHAVPSPPLPPSPHSPTKRTGVPVAPKDAGSMQRQQIALQQCGLVPLPRKDLSQLEKELDRKFSQVVVPPQDQPEQGELTTAEKIRREWQANNDQPVEQSGDTASKEPNRVAVEGQQTLEVPTPQALPRPTSPVSSYSFMGNLLFPDIPEEDVTTTGIEKPLPQGPPTESVDPFNIPLPDSPSAESPEVPPAPSPRWNKRLPPIDTTNDAEGTTEEASRGRSQDRRSAESLMTKSSLPALSPTMTASSVSSIPTPRDEESRERMEAMITQSTSTKPRISRYKNISDTGRHSEDLDVVHETIPETSEPPVTESKTWNPNRESSTTMGSTGFEAFVDKKEKRRRSTGIFQSNKRSSASSSRSSELSLRWSAIANDFSLKSFDGSRSRTPTLRSMPTLTGENKEPTPATEQPKPKITRSKSVIASLGLKMTRKVAPRSTLPPVPPSPVRQPTVVVMGDREGLMQDVKKIEDEESRRLTELAFVDF